MEVHGKVLLFLACILNFNVTFSLLFKSPIFTSHDNCLAWKNAAIGRCTASKLMLSSSSQVKSVITTTLQATGTKKGQNQVLDKVSTVTETKFSKSTKANKGKMTPLEVLKVEESRLMSLLNSVRSQKLANLQSKPQRIAVIGFGRFGQFIAKTFKK